MLTTSITTACSAAPAVLLLLLLLLLQASLLMHALQDGHHLLRLRCICPGGAHLAGGLLPAGSSMHGSMNCS
jgi:hypothetical protein